MSRPDKHERKPLNIKPAADGGLHLKAEDMRSVRIPETNPWARATYHAAATVKGACANVWIKIPVPPGTAHVQPHVMGEAFAAGCRLEHATVNGERRLVAAVKIGGITPSHVAVWAWEAE